VELQVESVVLILGSFVQDEKLSTSKKTKRTKALWLKLLFMALCLWN